MTGGTRFIAIDTPGSPYAGPADPNAAPEPGPDEASATPAAPPLPEPSESAATPRAPWLAALAGAGALGWTGLFLWGHGAAMGAGATPGAWAGWASEWSGPMLLIGVAWLLAMRHSRREAARYGEAARLLRHEAEALESRLITMNRELSLAREFLAAQSRDLDSLGRQATERLSLHADRLTELVRDNGTRVENISTVSTVALDNMERLRDQLPVMASSAKDVANNIGNAGRIAHGHLNELVGGLARLNDGGLSNERQVAGLRNAVETTLNALDERLRAYDDQVNARLHALADRADALHADLGRQQEEALAVLTRRAGALQAEIEATRHRLDSDEAESLTSLRARLTALRDEANVLSRRLRETESAALADWRGAVSQLGENMSARDEDIARMQAGHLAAAAQLGELTENNTARLAEVESRIATIAAADADLARALEPRLDLMGQRLGEAEQSITRLSESGLRLLELVSASTRESGENLPRAMATSEKQLVGLEERLNALRNAATEAHAHGEALATRALATRETLAGATVDAQALHSGLAERMATHRSDLAALNTALSGTLADLDAEVTRVAGHAQEGLTSAIAQLAGSARDAVNDLDARGSATVAALANRLGTDAAAAIERAMRHQTAETAGQLEQAASHAAGVSREAAAQLREQLVKVTELVDHLEARVAEARSRAEEQVDNDFARRAAVVTDALNSTAIDIAKTLGTDVSDTAWAAYLRGDRGIFTRRAVRLLDAGEARSVVQLYESDAAFSEAVNRFIHDFEAMLRQLLSTRDGHALSVTLLSSDMGKLYVALAQAIERLRN